MKSFKQFIQEALDDIPTKQGKDKVVIFVGRFSPPTKAHCQIIESAYKKYKKPVHIFIVRSESGKNTSPFPPEVQQQIFNESLSVPHEVHIVKTAFIGDFLTVLRDQDDEPIAMYCGTDRFKSYQDQLNRYNEKLNYNIELNEIKRDEESKENISGTNVRNALKNDDIDEFQRNMSKGAWKLFDKLKEYVK